MPVQPTAPVKKLVVLEEGTLLGIASNEVFLKEFPFLRDLRKIAERRARKGGCGGCSNGRGSTSQRSQVITAAKQAIVGMGDDKKRRLKQLHNTKQLRITYRSGSKVIQYTF